MTNAQSKRLFGWSLGFGHWAFVGHWNLVIGHSLSDPPCQIPAVDEDRLAAGEAGGGGDKVDGGADQLVGAAESRERRVLLDPISSRRALDQATVQRRRNEAGGDRVHANAVLGPVVRERF